jgi:hypothetical protein
MQKHENIVLTIDEKQVEINHSYDVDSGKPFASQENGLNDLKEVILEDIKNAKNFGSIPYNNFESQVDWHIL